MSCAAGTRIDLGQYRPEQSQALRILRARPDIWRDCHGIGRHLEGVVTTFDAAAWTCVCDGGFSRVCGEHECCDGEQAAANGGQLSFHTERRQEMQRVRAI
jgi:hypothetical protein